MYLDHFGLREAPFLITPHTEFFFSGANRGATLEALVYAITHDEGIVKVSGEVGSGKTMLCRMLLEKLPENVETVYLANPSLSKSEIVHAIAEELRITLPEGHAHHQMRLLQDRLLEIYTAGRLVVVMIDEAHAMPPETLEEIRLLSNLETSRHKLLHIVLFGQPELDLRLSDSSMRQLKDRITHNFALEPLRLDDIGHYLMFRIRAAGYRGPDLFTPAAVQLVSRASEGLTRRINILADKALLSAFSENRHQIDRKQVKAAIRDAQFTPMNQSRPAYLRWALAGVILAGVGILGYLAGSRPPSDRADTPPKGNTQAAAAAMPPLSAPPPPPAHTNPSPAPATALLPQTPLALNERIAACDAWIQKTPDHHFFIQLLSTDGANARGVEQFLDQISGKLDSSQIRVYRSSKSGRDRLGVIYGEFATRTLADSELARLSHLGLNSGPYVRSVGKLR